MISWPTNTRDIINDIRDAIGREVTFVTATISGCSTCTLDPITDTSTNSFCPVCSGTYWIDTYSGVTITGHTTWGQAEILNWYSAGQVYDGDCRVQIEYTDANLIILDTTKWLEVDNKKLEIKKKIYRGVPDLNRILLDCIELDKEL